MLRRVVGFLFWSICLLVAGSAIAWTDDVVALTEQEVNKAVCVDGNAPNNTIRILHAPTGEYMTEAEEIDAVLALNRALAANGRFAVTNARALGLLAPTMSQSEFERVSRDYSNAAVTIFFTPYKRQQGVVRANVTLVIRKQTKYGDISFPCMPAISVEVPDDGGSNEETGNQDFRRVTDFIKAFHAVSNKPNSCIELTRFYAPVFYVNGKPRTLAEQEALRCKMDSQRPETYLDASSIHVVHLGEGRFRASYANTFTMDEGGRRVTRNWYVVTEIETRNGNLQYKRIDLSSR